MFKVFYKKESFKTALDNCYPSFF